MEKEINGKVYTEGKHHDIEELREIIKILRSPDGCPWDKSQTNESMKPCLTNESQEVLDAIDAKDDDNLCEELGDVLLQILLHSEIASERGAFSFDDVIQVLADKMIRRHPYVFSDETVPESQEERHARWQAIKAEEKRKKAEKSQEKK